MSTRKNSITYETAFHTSRGLPGLQLCAQLQGLAHEDIASGKEHLRIQLIVMGVKLVDTSTAHYNLGLALPSTQKPAELHEAVALLNKASKIYVESLLMMIHSYWSTLCPWKLEQAETALARFEEPGVLTLECRALLVASYCTTRRRGRDGRIVSDIAGSQ